ncbi:phosphate acyltransferase PlsX [Aerococcaceae bacterium DSM 111020]|nr:phosphate acyltransferase PlsX [Aerococcaceae bacterium DSM 111020]
MIKIALDAMSGDFAPDELVKGAMMAVSVYDDIEIQLFGDEDRIQSLLTQPNDRISIVHTTEVITGEDEPTKAVRRKKDSSMVKAARSVKEGHNDAMVTAGNTGAALTTAIAVIGRIKHVKRPGLAPAFPTLTPEKKPLILLDAGANVDLDPEHLHQFAILGSVYAEGVFEIDNPKIGLLNNGTEELKGNRQTKEAFQLLKEEERINFVGNVEPTHLLTGECDVLVSDGFTGNIAVKTLEGAVKNVMKYLKTTLSEGNIQTKLGGLLIKNALTEAVGDLGEHKIGGAVFLGIDAPIIKAHGNSNDEAILNAIRQARTAVKNDFVQKTRDYFEQ